MSANPIAAAGAATSQTAATNPYAQMNSGEFMNIMLTELSNQDPFAPNDSQAILEQLSSLRSIESDLKLQEKLESLVLQNSIGQAGALIGMQVEGIDTANDPISGIVTAVRVKDGQAQLELDSGRTLALDRVLSVSEPAAGGQAAVMATPPATAAATTANDTAAALLSTLTDSAP